jgi:hypothetical protein
MGHIHECKTKKKEKEKEKEKIVIPYIMAAQ